MAEYTIGIVLLIFIVGIIKIICVVRDEHERAAYRYHSRNYARNEQPANRPVARSSNNNQHATVGPVIYYGNSNHNASDVEFKFLYMYKGGSWRAYIMRQPSLNGRSEDLHSTHRHYDSDNNRHYVCWLNDIAQLKDMQNISKAWADNILEYIATGKTF